MDLVELSSKFSAVTDYLGAKFEEIAGEIKGMLEQTGERREQTMLARNIEARIHQLLYLMEHTDLSLKEYREDVIKEGIIKAVIFPQTESVSPLKAIRKWNRSYCLNKYSRSSRYKADVFSPLHGFSAMF